MTALFLYGAVLLMVASVMVNRFGQRRTAVAARQLGTDEAALRTLDHKLVEGARQLQIHRQRATNIDDHIADVRLAIDNLNDRLEKTKAAPMERYYIFDRLDPRPGTIWALQVSRTGDGPAVDARLSAAWRNPRTYLIVAGNQREAMDRAAQRFPRNHGYDVGTAAPCHLFKGKRQGRDEPDLVALLSGGAAQGRSQRAAAG